MEHLVLPNEIRLLFIVDQIRQLYTITLIIVILHKFIVKASVMVSSQASFTQPFMFEVTYGIIMATALLIEPLQFLILRRLSKFIYSSFTFFIAKAYNYVFVYYSNFTFTSFSLFYIFYTFLSLYLHEPNSVSGTIPITESQIQAGYAIGYRNEHFPFHNIPYKLKLLFLILSFLVLFTAKKYVERYYKPNAPGISMAYNFYTTSSLFAISSDNFIGLCLSLELQSSSLTSLAFAIFGEQAASPNRNRSIFKNS